MTQASDGQVTTVTVLFTDVAGSTAQRTALGDDAADELVLVYDRLLRAAVAENRGSVVKSTGDGLHAVFDAASEGVAAAIAIQQAFELHNRRAAELEQLAVRVGLSAGDVQFLADDCHGTPVVEAARLETAAASGEILISDLVRLLVGSRGGYVFEPVGELELKGLGNPVRAHRVQWGPSTVDAPAAPSTDATPEAFPLPLRLDARAAFVGRVDERAAITRALATANDEAMLRVVLVSGEAGIGKTSLMAACARDAHDAGSVVLYGRCDDLGIPYQPWADALGHLVRNAPGTVLRDHVEARGGELARLVPEIARLAPASAPARTDHDAERYLLFGAVVDLLARTSATAPVMLVLDDLHSADKPSLLLLRYVVGAEVALRGAIVATYRSDEAQLDDALSDTIVGLYRGLGADRVTLGGLDPSAVLALMELNAGHELDADGIALRDALVSETDGNPFFVTETLRHLAETGVISQEADGRWVAETDLDSVGLPATVREVIEQRVSRLGPEPHRILGLASVIGRDFDLDLLAAVADIDEEAVLDVLELASAAALVRTVPERAERFTFVHALIERTLYEELTPARRVRAHRRVAEALLVIDLAAAESRPGELARHWIAAEPGGTEALRFARLAGENAAARLAPQDAMRWFEEAERVLDRQTTADPRVRCELLLDLGVAQRDAGDGEYRGTLLRAAALAEDLAEHEFLVRAALENTRGWASEAGAVDHERVEVLSAALAQLGADDRATRARLLATLAAELSYGSVWPERLELTDEALALVRAAGDDDALSYVLARRAHSVSVPDTLAQRLRDSAENVALTERLANPIARFWALMYRNGAMVSAGDASELARQLSMMREIADTVRLPILRWEATIQESWVALLGGRLADADRLAFEGLAIATASGQPDAGVVFAAAIFLTRLDQGRLDEIVSVVAQTAAENPGIPGLRVSLAWGYCELGRDEEARDLLLAEAEGEFAHVPYDQFWLVTLAQWAYTAEHVGERDAAAYLYESLVPWEAQVAFTGAHVFGGIALSLGLCASTLHRFDDGERHFADAVRIHDGLGAPVWSARCRLGWAWMLLACGASGDAARAITLAAEAEAVAADLGCRSLGEQGAALRERREA